MSRYKVPENLIEQVQILLRKEASFEHFNPSDPEIPPFPTLEDAIAGIGTSENQQVRCRNCKGELLRGEDSIICVYCGLGKECDTKEIGFRSTSGCGWLLQALRLDGSEYIGPSIGDTQSNREQSSIKDGVVLSDFLNLNLKWPDESSRLGIINESLLAGDRPGTLIGVDLNELSLEGSRDSTFAVHSEQVGTSKKIETNEAAPVTQQRSLNLFEDKKSSESSLRANEGENDDDDSGWAAEFQSAVPDARHEHTQSFEAAGPPDDNASHINSVPGHIEVEKLANMSSSPAHSRNDLASDDLDLSFGLPSRSKQSEGSVIVENVEKVLEPGDSTGFTWPLDDLQKTPVADDPSVVKSEVADDSFDDWNDFRSSTDVQTSNPEPSTATPSGTETRGLDSSDGWKDLTGSVGTENKQPKTNVSSAPEGDFLDAWNDFTVSSSAGEIEVDRGGDADADASKSSTFNQVDSVDLWSNGVSMAVEDDLLVGLETKSPTTVTTQEVDDSFDLWNDFKSSTGETQQVNIVKGADDRLSTKDDKPRDLWDDFASLGASKNEETISGEKAINGSFSSWNDPTESSSVSVSKPMNNDISFGEWGDFSSSAASNTDQHQSSGQNVAESQTIMDSSTFDAWGDFGQSTLMPEKQVQAAETELSDNKQIGDDTDFFSGWIGSSEQSASAPNNRENSNGVTEHVENSVNETDDSFDAWTGFTSSTNVPASQPLSSSANAPVDKDAVKNDDIFDSWNVFTSSSNVQPGDSTIAPKENMPEVSFFNTITDSQGLERDDKQDVLFGVTSDQNGPSQQVGSPPEVSDLVRTENGGAKQDVDGSPKQSNQSATSISSGVKSSDVETLISEMHDLSFLLETSLKIPKSQP